MAVRSPVIALVGRPNVGKSTLFNKIAGSKIAVVEDFPGVTRDRNYSFVERFSVPFYVVDTGGFELDSEDEMQHFVADQVRAAIDEADILFVLFDGRAGLHPGDRDVVDLLRGAKQKVYFLVNKCDGLEQERLKVDFYELGVDNLIDISAEHGRGVREAVENALQAIPNYNALLDSWKAKKAAEELAEAEAKEKMEAAIAEAKQLYEGDDEDEEEEDLEDEPEEEEEEEPTFAPVHIPEDDASAEEYEKMFKFRDLPNPRDAKKVTHDEPEPDSYVTLETIRVAIIGRPNVGKSTFLNKILGEARAITSPISGTTRDALDVTITRNGQEYCLIDTAGIRRKARITDRIEKFSVMRSLQALSSCDVALLLLDATAGPVEQDAKVLGLAHEEGKGVVIVINKWDLIEKDHTSVTKYKQQIKDVFKFTPYAPILFISAMTGQRCPKVLEVVKTVAEERAKRVPTGRLNRILRRSTIRHSAPVYRGRSVKLYYGAQITSAPPKFALFFNYPKEVHFSYLRYLKNAIREEFGFEGTDIKLSLRRRSGDTEK